MDFILFVWLTIHEPQPNGLVHSRKVTIRTAYPSMAACKEAQALAEAAYAKAPVPNLLINCVVETEEDRDVQRKRIAERMDRLAELCAKSQNPIICHNARTPPPKYAAPSPRFTNPYAKRGAD